MEFLFNSLKNLYHHGDDVVALGGIVNCTKEGEVPCHFPGVHPAAPRRAPGSAHLHLRPVAHVRAFASAACADDFAYHRVDVEDHPRDADTLRPAPSRGRRVALAFFAANQLFMALFA